MKETLSSWFLLLLRVQFKEGCILCLDILYPMQINWLQSLFSLCILGRTQHRILGGVVDQLHQLGVGEEILSADQWPHGVSWLFLLLVRQLHNPLVFHLYAKEVLVILEIQVELIVRHSDPVR